MSAGPVGMELLSAQGLTLEPLVESHAEAMFEVLSDPAIYQYENQPPHSKQSLSERYVRLQRRRSPDATEIWLNWVIRLESGELCGYVQATVRSDHSALIAYELASRFWNKRIGSTAVTAMLEHLTYKYQIRQFLAVFKTANFRSAALLCSLGFKHRTQDLPLSLDLDEAVMYRDATMVRTKS